MAFVDNTIEVEADVRDVYDAWTAFEDYPTFMEVVETVDLVPDEHLHWVAVVEDDIVEWDADVVEHVPEQRVTWRAIDGRETGQVTFDKVAGDKTRIHYQLDYDPKAWDGEPDKVRRWMRKRVDDGLKTFKEIVETEE